MSSVLKILSKILRIPSWLKDKVDLYFKMASCVAGDDVHLFSVSRIENNQSNPNSIKFGAHSKILGQFLVMGHGGTICIGESCFVGEHSRIWSANSIIIGDRVLISHNVNIHDHNSHSLSAESRHIHFNQIFSAGHPAVLADVPSAPVVIEDDVWIGFNATILKGVTVGKGAIIGACSLVTKDVAAYTVVAGSPARIIGSSKP